MRARLRRRPAGSQRSPLSADGPCCQPSATEITEPSTSNTRPVTSRESALPSHTTSGEMFAGSLRSNPDPALACVAERLLRHARPGRGAIAFAVTP
jgi:hypothetical protein